MNSKSSRLILYLIVALLVTGALALLVFVQPILNSLQLPVNLSSPASFSAESDMLDTQALEDPRLATLVQHVQDFDFDNICFRPENSTGRFNTAVITKDETGGNTNLASSTITKVICAPGNNLPFASSKVE
ncbi:hypothetical protein GW920_00165 [Candidatus Falkowbacteria bacterium]|uniref:Uncharacterized protein n=1 Tax=Candidatus Falkowbacteria bacterium CG10_big_fil_rev_8_21_14_0_10_37_18 TaxID=1974562 RepID=A0A2H0V9K3_9BACT|nr:hypothetical protein [Candidatus Falkowbacteria bacterium]NCQ12869.1 hypothetical protein [Candidatus Falkowbacteria bacterium]OIO05457.1 MAG: hypothetical protein AUJ26_03210 [Candidatus Falkowbacteria bacterium CG1_02_37_21]PIR95772.1 MAG: hypothetical protein COT93_00560 [Candidatus Falkowbacteria bacterium CG10_big_fil_rev_8_21_14_0_10_37_18]